MGSLINLFGGGGGGGFDSGVVGSPASAAVPLAPRIPDVIQPSDPQIQQAQRTSKQRSTFLGRTRGGTLLRRARAVEAPTAAVLLGRKS